MSKKAWVSFLPAARQSGYRPCLVACLRCTPTPSRLPPCMVMQVRATTAWQLGGSESARDSVSEWLTDRAPVRNCQAEA